MSFRQADRKDPGHSGHTDSVYYAHVKADIAWIGLDLVSDRSSKLWTSNRLS